MSNSLNLFDQFKNALLKKGVDVDTLESDDSNLSRQSLLIDYSNEGAKTVYGRCSHGNFSKCNKVEEETKDSDLLEVNNTLKLKP